MLPTAEELARELMTNYKLSILLARLKVEEDNGWGGMDVIKGHEFKFEWSENGFDGDEISHDDKRRMIPYLRRLGYSVGFFNDSDTFTVDFAGFAYKKRTLSTPRPHWGDYLYPRTFCQVRMWGLLRCIVKLNTMADRARAAVRAKPGGVDFVTAQQAHASSGGIGM